VTIFVACGVEGVVEMKRYLLAVLTGAALVISIGGAGAALASPSTAGPTTIRVSVSSQGRVANSYAFEPAISDNGRYVAYFSDASNLVPNDTNGWNDVFVYDTVTQTVERVSVTSNEQQVARGGQQPSISRDGRYVAFASDDPGLVSGDTNGFSDIFVRDRGAGTTTRVSVTSSGAQMVGGGASAAEMSGDGRYVVYWSAGTNLVAGDTNDNMDVFRYDRVTHQTTRVSVGNNGQQALGQSGYPGGPDISNDGRFVVFESDASNLVGDDANGPALDVFVRDTVAQRTVMISRASNGAAGNLDSYWPSISANGRYIAFNSDATNLVTNDTNDTWDIFVRDRWTGTTTRVSVASNGQQGNDVSYPPDISGDGRYVTFFSIASNLVANDTNNTWDIFVYDRGTGTTFRASVSSSGDQSNGASQLPSISYDGHVVVYESEATNLVRPDPNRTTDALATQW
jgi:Tol biopolymer transport system component